MIKFESGSDNDRVRKAASKVLELAYDRVTRQLCYYPKVAIPVVLYDSHKSYVSATEAPEWSGGAYNRGDGTIRMGMNIEAFPEPVMVAKLAHELTHLVVDIITRHRIPTWLNEGLAQMAEMTDMSQTDLLLAGAMDSMGGALPPLVALEKSITAGGRLNPRLGYAMAYSATRFLIAREGEQALFKILEQLGRDVPIQKAMKIDYQTFQAEWAKAVAAQKDGL